MVWSLEIHHIDVGGAGDSTLILAKNTVTGHVTMQSSMLVDGGLGGAGLRDVHDYLRNKLRLTSLDVIVSTHYDADHLDGLTRLLSLEDTAENIYGNTIVYDQGMPVSVTVQTTRVADEYLFGLPGYPNTNVTNFFSAIGNRIHPTKNVFAAGCEAPTAVEEKKDPGPDPDKSFVIDPNGNSLLSKELLWSRPRTPSGVYKSGSRGPLTPNDPEAFKIKPPAGAPTVTCIAANGYVLNGPRGSNAYLVSPVSGGFDANGKSLALEVRFGDFKYYLGGDLTSLQEDGKSNDAGLMHYLLNDKVPVKAMKASHHGSSESTSAEFLGKLQPTVVFVSNGVDNKYDHPAQATLDRLNACKTVQNFFLTGPTFDRTPPLNDGSKGVIAGYWHVPPAPAAPRQLKKGNIVLTVDGSAAMKVYVCGDDNDIDADDNDQPYPLVLKTKIYQYK